MKIGPQQLGTTRKYDVRLTAPDGSSLAAVFNGAETITAEIWPGDDQPASATLAAEWAPTSKYADNPAIANPYVRITVTAAAIANLLPGEHPIRCVIEPGTDDIAVLPTDAVLILTSAPGAATALKQYISAQFLRDICPTLETVQVLQSDQTGFAEKRSLARKWFEKLLHNGTPRGVIGDHLHGWLAPGYPGRDRWLQEQLDAEKLIVTDEIKLCLAYYALGLILTPLVGSKETTALQGLGCWYAREAQNLVKTIIAELDTNAVTGTTAGTPTTTSIPCTGSELSTEDDAYNGWYLKLTSGAQAGELRAVTDYVGSTLTFATEAFSVAPSAGVNVTILDGLGEYAIDLSQVRVTWG